MLAFFFSLNVRSAPSTSSNPRSAGSHSLAHSFPFSGQHRVTTHSCLCRQPPPPRQGMSQPVTDAGDRACRLSSAVRKSCSFEGEHRHQTPTGAASSCSVSSPSQLIAAQGYCKQETLNPKVKVKSRGPRMLWIRESAIPPKAINQ